MAGEGRGRAAAGWVAVALSAAIATVWSYWGALENFHEGWYLRSAGANLALALGQYLGPALLFVALGLLALRFPRIGALALAAAGVAALFFFGLPPRPGGLLVAVPLLLLAGLWYVARPPRPALASWLLAGPPLALIAAISLWMAPRIATRFDDGNLGERRVLGEGVALSWAPAGPGWPRQPVPWAEAVRRCRHLSRDGRALEDTVVDAWRLPTAEEAVRSMQRHGRSAGGQWIPGLQDGRYRVEPDKESPLWDVHSPIVYWWTSTEVDPAHARIIVYDGRVWPRAKTQWMGFRAVRSDE